MEPPIVTGGDALAPPCGAGDEDPVATPERRMLELARARLARSTASESESSALGAILLRPDQAETVRRVRAHLRRDGGCLLADDVGTGKTYVALAVAREWRRPLVVAPASLRSTWEQASRLACVSCRFASHESLSRGRLPDDGCDGIIVDESHRFRPTSRRHAALARLTARAPVLLLSATPVQNRLRELAGQLALFVGEAAFGLAATELTRWTVRSVAGDRVHLPRVAPPGWVPIDADDEEVLRAILALPPPPRASDAGDGGVLLQLSLVRAWASSRAALVAAVRRRRRTAAAIEQCHHEGRQPSRRELRSWHAGDDVQLGFPTLLATSVIERDRGAELARAIERERAALDVLGRTIDRVPDPDRARIAALLALRASHMDASIIAFSEWASTVRAYWSALRAEPNVGLLTASEARIASGRVARAEMLARFAPRAQGAPRPAAHARVTLLLATDLLSEGVNLQDASVVVHLDLPWNPARLAQRVGRVRRPGGASEVAAYLLSPPASAALLLEAESRLRVKLARAERVIGRGIEVLPVLTPATAAGLTDGEEGRRAERGTALSDAELRGEIARRLTRWQATVTEQLESAAEPIVGVAHANEAGWVAALDDGRLIASSSIAEEASGWAEAPSAIVRALAAAEGPPRVAQDEERDSALAAIHAWIARDWARHSCGLSGADAPMRRRVLRALDGVMPAAPRHRRAALLVRIAALRRALALPLPLGAEREFAALVEAAGRHPDWIERAVAIVERVPPRARHAAGTRPARVRAVIVFGPDTRESRTSPRGESGAPLTLAARTSDATGAR